MAINPEKIDILVGIASYNNAKTIGHVVKAVDAGLAKYFPDKKAVIVNSDGGSADGTPDVVRNATFDHAAIFLSHPVYPAHRISIPYNGIPGKGSAFRKIFSKPGVHCLYYMEWFLHCYSLQFKRGCLS